jgi:hypothetical protein
MVTVLVAALFLALIRGPMLGAGEINALLVCLLIYIIWIYPILIVHRLTIEANRIFQSFEPDDEQTPEPVRSSIQILVPKLQALGFTALGHYQSFGDIRSVKSFGTLFENRQARQLARLFTVTWLAGPSARQSTTLVFWTEFTNGTKLVTSNGALSDFFPPIRLCKGSAALPQIHDPCKLHEIHQASLVRFAADAVRRAPELGNPAEYLSFSGFEEHLKQLETGYLYLDKENWVFRSTWKGAILRGLKLRWPMKQLHYAARRQRARRLLSELGIG